MYLFSLGVKMLNILNVWLSYFRCIDLFMTSLKWIILEGDKNAVFDTSLDRRFWTRRDTNSNLDIKYFQKFLIFLNINHKLVIFMK